MDKVRIGIIGVGGIANRVHIRQLLEVKAASIVAVCDIDPQNLNSTADKLGLPAEKRYTDYRQLIDDPEVDAVEICTSNDMHVEMAVYAIKAGKHVNVEKPISTDCATLPPLQEALKNVDQDKQVCMACFSYRFYPAVRYAKHLIERGGLGRIINVSVEYMKDSGLWKDRPMEWRFEKEKAGTGVLGDLGVHLVDMVRLLIADIDSVVAHTEIIIKERPIRGSSEIGTVETDDFCTFIARLKNSAMVNFSISRCALGEKNSIRFDIYGTKGMLSVDLNNPKVLGVCYAGEDPASAKIEVVDVPAEYTVMQEESFVNAVLGKKVAHFPTIDDAIECQRILDAVLLSSQTHTWVTL